MWKWENVIQKKNESWLTFSELLKIFYEKNSTHSNFILKSNEKETSKFSSFPWNLYKNKFCFFSPFNRLNIMQFFFDLERSNKTIFQLFNQWNCNLKVFLKSIQNYWTDGVSKFLSELSISFEFRIWITFQIIYWLSCINKYSTWYFLKIELIAWNIFKKWWNINPISKILVGWILSYKTDVDQHIYAPFHLKCCWLHIIFIICIQIFDLKKLKFWSPQRIHFF